MIAGATFLIAARTVVIVFVLFIFSMFFYKIRSLCTRGGHCTYYASMCIEKHTHTHTARILYITNLMGRLDRWERGREETVFSPTVTVNVCDDAYWS